jgi:hypothetical protein
MGNVPRLIDDEMWFRTQVRLVEELGAAETLTRKGYDRIRRS